ncbi:MAG: hypothetical protein AUI64_03530 [Acidobacteria bacterium 13_1_40CM_2_64_6]|nr:MAG: hypothetical protein AUI64_03530 [Acidobacteria bacterium 13_1_40CM_2_64_6]
MAVVGVQFKLDGANYGAEDTTSPYSTSWNTTTVSNGSHTLTAIARDAAGNQTTSSPVTVTVSNSAAGPAKWTGSGRINVPGGLGYFGFFITRAADGTLSGQLEYYFDATGFDFDAPNMLTLTVTGNKAVITGTGMERFGNGAWSGPYNFTATVQDLGTSGTTDTFKIQISDPGATSAGSDTTTLIYGNIVKYY